MRAWRATRVRRGATLTLGERGGGGGARGLGGAAGRRAYLERSMDDGGVVELLEAVADLDEQVPREVLAQPLLPLLHRVDQVVQRLIGELGHVAQPALGEERLVVACHVGVLQLEQRLSLAHRALLAVGRQVGLLVHVDALECVARLLVVHVHCARGRQSGSEAEAGSGGAGALLTWHVVMQLRPHLAQVGMGSHAHVHEDVVPMQADNWLLPLRRILVAA